MRHIRTRRRLRFILSVLFSASLILLLENKLVLVAPQVKTVVEKKIESVFGDKFALSIGDIDGGLVRPFILNNVKVKDANGSEIFGGLEIKSIRSNYRIWDFLFKGKVASFFRIKQIRSRIDVNFATTHKRIVGALKIEGDIADADVKGRLLLLENRRIDFTGRIEQGKYRVYAFSKGWALNAEGLISEDPAVVTRLKINHLKLQNLDVVCDITLKNRFVRNMEREGAYSIEGEFSTDSLILNYAPFMEVHARYRIADGIVHIPDFQLGDGINISAKISLRSPYNVNVTCVADNAKINKILAWSGDQKNAFLSGVMNGRLNIKGPGANAKSFASFEVKKGTLGGLDFEILRATLRGDGPIVRIEDSRILRKSGSFSLAGEIDVRKAGRATLFSDVKLVSDDKAILWDLWDAVRMQDVKEITMTKKMSEEVNLGFKKFVSDKRVDESLREKDQVEVEYKLHPNESLKMMFGEGKEFIGLEHKDRF